MDGVLIVDKPRGITSHDVVDFIRRKFGVKKAGHAGTLDPMATGVLVMLIGKYTKRSNAFMAGAKEYEATIVLGAESDTLDACGNIRPTNKKTDFSRKEIESVFEKFVGQIEQEPPMYSAVKFKGRKLYELARKGVEVKREPRRVVIEKLEILDCSLPQVSFRVVCSKGTYVRQLASDIGSSLGCGAYLSALRRLRSGPFNIKDAVTLDLLKNLQRADIEKRLIQA